MKKLIQNDTDLTKIHVIRLNALFKRRLYGKASKVTLWLSLSLSLSLSLPASLHPIVFALVQ